MSGYYVSVMSGARRGLLLGPFTEHSDAEARVDEVREYVKARDSWAHFYYFGTARVLGESPDGRLNDALSVY